MRVLKQSTASIIMVFVTDKADHVTGYEDTPVFDIGLSKNGGDFGLITPTVTNKGNGWFKVELTSSHTDTEGDLVLHMTHELTDPTDIVMSVIPNTISDLFLYINELHTIAGLKIASPSTTTQTTWIAGDIELAIAGDGITTTTFTRQP